MYLNKIYLPLAGLISFCRIYKLDRYQAENNILSLTLISLFFHFNFTKNLSHVKQDKLNKQKSSWTSLEQLSLNLTEQSLADAFDAHFFAVHER